jgi:hypothetical protein
VQKKPVQTGISTANHLEILSGLRQGDKVIAANLATYQPGELVQPRLDTMAVFQTTEAQ